MTCSAENCDRAVVVKSLGLCDAHYRRHRAGKPLGGAIEPQVRYAPICSVNGCGGKHFSLGLCSGHYNQKRKGRTLTPIRRAQSREGRFWSKVEKSADCWLWTGAKTSLGYGNFSLGKGVNQGAHRFAWIALRGNLTEGLVLDHLCRTPSCVNPEHLQPVPQQINVLRGRGPGLASIQNVDKTKCKHGHSLFGPNLYVQPSTGYRYCRTCMKASKQRSKSRNKAAASKGAG